MDGQQRLRPVYVQNKILNKFAQNKKQKQIKISARFMLHWDVSANAINCIQQLQNINIFLLRRNIRCFHLKYFKWLQNLH